MHYGVSFNFDKVIWIAAAGYCVHWRHPLDTLVLRLLCRRHREIFGVLGGNLHQLGSSNLQDIFIGRQASLAKMHLSCKRCELEQF